MNYDLAEFILAIISILINVGLTIWIVYSLQRRLNDRRVIKDYFIETLSKHQNNLDILINDIISKKEIEYFEVTQKFTFLLNKQETFIKELKKYKIESPIVDHTYHLFRIVTEPPEQQKQKGKIIIEPLTILIAYSKCDQLFYEIISKVNNYLR